MIRSFADKRTAAIFTGLAVKGLPPGIQRRAKAKLHALDAAAAVDDLRSPPGNRLERLKGDRAEQYSIRVNDQWRICFVWRGGDARDAGIATIARIGTMTIKDEDLDRGRIDLSTVASGGKLKPVHPGEILRDEFLEPFGISVYALAKAIHVPRSRANDIVLGRRGVSADTAMRLGRYLGTTPEFWVNLQSRYDLDVARRTLRGTVERDIEPRAA
jgi:addiction module HigA family antidote